MGDVRTGVHEKGIEVRRRAEKARVRGVKVYVHVMNGYSLT